LAAPPVVLDFSNATTLAPFSAAAIAAAKPDKPAATTITSVFYISHKYLLSLFIQNILFTT
jgi:hypothetical protein